jgi:glycosyltransferase involved in cell wall biosynthesis
MERKIPLHWTTKDRDAFGNGLGYAIHDRMMFKHSEPYFEYTDNAQIALHIVAGDVFKPLPGKFNVLFTMWEFLDLPNSYIRSLNLADAIIVPCRFCKDLFAKYTDKPIYVCQEGIVPEDYPYFDRNPDGQTFRFMWCGAPNMRKGYPFVLKLMEHLGNTKGIEFYFKTTIPRIDPKVLMESAMTHLNIDDKKVKEAMQRTADRVENGMKMDEITYLGDRKNIIFDTRKISIPEMRDLYNKANCFLLPTMGEGWGLTLCEAMATGCPSIAANITGVKEYFNEQVGLEIGTAIQEIDLSEQYGIKARSYIPNYQDLLGRCLQAMRFYPQFLKMGKKGSERIHSKFTWPRSASRLHDIISEIEKEYLKNATTKSLVLNAV